MSLPKEVALTTQTHQEYKLACQTTPPIVCPDPPPAEQSAFQAQTDKISQLIQKLKN